MSTAPIGNAIQDLALNIMSHFDANKDGQFSVTEFSSFLDRLMTGMGSTPASTLPGAAATREPGTPAVPADTSAWDTHEYAIPQHVAQNPGQVMPGWDAANWANPNMQTPKYVVGRILSQYPHTIAGLADAMAEIRMAYPGSLFDGKDKVTIPGVGTIDVLQAAGGPGGGVAWQWLPIAGQ